MTEHAGFSPASLPNTPIAWAILLALATALLGCASVEKGSREEAIRSFGYMGAEEELHLGAPTISPMVVGRGERLTRVLPITLLAPRKETTFSVLETVSMSGEGVLIELWRRESERPQGTYASTLQFIIPNDLPRGNYTLITVVTANGVEKRDLTSFVVGGD